MIPLQGATTALTAEQVELIRCPLRAEGALFDAAGGTEVRASVSIRGSGLIGRVLARAADALLAAGALDRAISRIARQLKVRTRDLSLQPTVPHHRTSGSHSTSRARLPRMTVTRLAPAPAKLLWTPPNGAGR